MVHVPSGWRASGSVLVDQPLKSPASVTWDASPAKVNCTPSGVTRGGAALPVTGVAAGAAVAAAAGAPPVAPAPPVAAPAAPPTTTTEFLPPKPSSAVSVPASSAFHVEPSITHLYG